ncbi:MAG: hypothetical protein AAGB15_15940, partial [Pseudomonadota bacterium]
WAQTEVPADLQAFAESARAYSDPLKAEDCAAALPAWRDAAAIGGPEQRLATFFALTTTIPGTWGPCFGAVEDRQKILSVVLDMSAGPRRDANLLSAEVLARLIGDDWLETLAKTGDIRFVVLAAEAHSFCSEQGDPPFVRSYGDFADLVAQACEASGMPAYIGTPDLDRGLFWYAVALKRDAWPEVTSVGRLSTVHSFAKIGAHRDYQRDPLAEIEARGLTYSSPDALGVLAHFTHETFVQDFVHRGSAARYEAAEAKADRFVPMPLDLSD